MRLKKMVFLALFLGLLECLNAAFGNNMPAKNSSRGGISFKTMYVKNDLKELNEPLKSFGLESLSDSQFLFGGEFFSYINNSLLISLDFYKGGTDVSGKASIDINSGGQNQTISISRDAEYSIWYAGMSMKYIYPISRGVEFYSGFSLNYGNTSILLSQHRGDMSFGETVDSFDPSDENFALNRNIDISINTYLGKLMNGVRYFVADNIGIDVGVGYTYGFSDKKGSLNGINKTYQIPDLDFKGLTYCLGIVFSN